LEVNHKSRFSLYTSDTAAFNKLQLSRYDYQFLPVDSINKENKL